MSVKANNLKTFTRRGALSSTLAWSMVSSANAAQRCLPDGRCVAEIPLSRFPQIFALQQTPVWCWAATLEMLFKAYGYAVSQSRIVQETFGAVIAAPAGNTETIIRATNRVWTDDAGRAFRASTNAVYDAWHGINRFSNDQLIAELAAERPLIYWNLTHMMLVTAVEYIPRPGAPVAVTGLGFFDPYPGQGGARGSRGGEMRARELGGEMTFLAAVSISAV